MNARISLNIWLVLSALLLGMACTAVGRTIFVDANAPGANDGSSWANAYNYLQDGLAAASSGDEVWVAQGVYKPDANSADPNGSGDREATFRLINGVAIRGGYVGFGEPDPNARGVDVYETILSGDLNGNDVGGWNDPSRHENSYHVVTASLTDQIATLDGFSVIGGRRWNTPYGGGGMYNYSSSPTVTNCTFMNNSGYVGGGICNEGGRPTLINCTFRDNTAHLGGGMGNKNSSPMLLDCAFPGNFARSRGGGIYNTADSSPVLRNCTFGDNFAQGYGGGMCNEGSDPTVIDCMFHGNWTSENIGRGGGMSNLAASRPTVIGCAFIGNSAGSSGGAINDERSSSTLTNCIFSGNSAAYGGGMLNSQSSATLTNCTFSANSGYGIWDGWGGSTLANCILWGDTPGEIYAYFSTPVVNYCCIQGWTCDLGGTGNIGDNPLFKDADGADDILGTEDDNLRLSYGSPCIDAGDNVAVPADISDLDDDGNTTEQIPWDLDRHLRFVDEPDTTDTGNGTPPIVDMGAYERGVCGDPDHPYPVMDFNHDCTVDFVDFAFFTNRWLECTHPDCD